MEDAVRRQSATFRPWTAPAIPQFNRLPDGAGPAPLVFGINGLDSRKEGVIAGSEPYIEHGAAASAIDMPGTGQAPILIDVGAERMFSAALDYLAARPEIDASRIVVQGRSWSGYWAAVLAYTEKDRILGAAVHGVGIHHYYQQEWQEHAVLSREYLFDLFPARSVVYGVETMEDFFAYGPRLSLLERGLIDQPSAPMLLVNGEQDTQQPISDQAPSGKNIRKLVHDVPRQLPGSLGDDREIADPLVGNTGIDYATRVVENILRLHHRIEP